MARSLAVWCGDTYPTGQALPPQSEIFTRSRFRVFDVQLRFQRHFG